MGVAERKIREKEQRRDSILAAAERVIVDKGIDAATMDEIAEAAEVGKGTLYLYFRNKSALYLAFQEKWLDQLLSMYGSVLTEQRTGIELMRRIGEEYVLFVKSHPDYLNIMTYGDSLNKEELMASEVCKRCVDKADRLLSFVIRAIQIGISDGSIRKELNPRELGLHFWGGISGVVELYHRQCTPVVSQIIREGDLSLDKMIFSHLDLMFEAIKPIEA